eukprot:TRINITY_DN4375_c0_g1_i1.p1 TRINITY_DN4375_c0_g1~~TRINITY_DN4375_c0_g1_i1.p1  ORF type:complete len:1100 (+),score=385.46 TRINITY_DN4375_c0_g1_i1:114-3413(+)
MGKGRGKGGAGKMKTQSNSVRVMVRVRPFNKREIQISEEKGEKLMCCVDMSDDVCSVLEPEDTGSGPYGSVKPGNEYQYDYCFWSIPESVCVDFPMSMNGFADQIRVYDVTGAEALKNAWDAFNTCIFAYGQTGAGKSYSMLGTIEGEHMGISPRIIEGLFEHIEAEKTDHPTIIYRIECTFLEIYNEQVKDLFAKKKSSDYATVKIRQHPVFGVQVVGLESKELVNAKQGKHEMEHGMSQRALASTNMNATSSRSHAIFQIHVHTSHTDSKSTGHATINLVDLAGSERIGKTGASGQTADEGKAINKSLSTLRKVIDTLIENSKSKGAKKVPPYRESMLTWVLKDSLGGNSKTMMICAISPHADNIDDTISTLRYGLKAKAIVNKAVKQEVSVDKQARELKAQMAEREQALKDAVDGGGGGGMSEEERAALQEEMTAELEAAQEEMQRNTEVMEKMVMKEKQTKFAAAFRSAFIIEGEKDRLHKIEKERDSHKTQAESLANELKSTKDEAEKTVAAAKKHAAEAVAAEKKRADETIAQVIEEEKEHAQSLVENEKMRAAALVEREKKSAAEAVAQAREEADQEVVKTNKEAAKICDDKERRLDNAYREIADTKKQLESAEKRIEGKVKDLQQRDAVIADQEKEIDEYEKLTNDKEAMLNMTSDQLKQVELVAQEYEAELKSIRSKVKKNTDEKKALTDRLRSEEKRARDKEEDYKKLELTYKKVRDERQRLEVSREELRLSATSSQATLKSLSTSLLQALGVPMSEMNMILSYGFADDDEFNPEDIEAKAKGVNKAVIRLFEKLTDDYESERQTRELQDEELYRLRNELRETVENSKRTSRTNEESLMRERQKSSDLFSQLRETQQSAKRNEEVLREELKRVKDRAQEEMETIMERIEYERKEMKNRDDEQRNMLIVSNEEVDDLRKLVGQLQSELYISEESIADLHHRKDHYKKQCKLFREMHEADARVIHTLGNDRACSPTYSRRRGSVGRDRDPILDSSSPLPQEDCPSDFAPDERNFRLHSTSTRGVADRHSTRMTFSDRLAAGYAATRSNSPPLARPPSRGLPQRRAFDPAQMRSLSPVGDRTRGSPRSTRMR